MSERIKIPYLRKELAEVVNLDFEPGSKFLDIFLRSLEEKVYAIKSFMMYRYAPKIINSYMQAR
jgi:hypothetical protein